MPTIATFGDGTDEHITADMCRRVEALSPEAALVVKWAIRMEGILHRIEEFPEHEPDYPEGERYSDPRKLADAVLDAPINKSLQLHLREFLTSPLGMRDLPPMA